LVKNGLLNMQKKPCSQHNKEQAMLTDKQIEELAKKHLPTCKAIGIEEITVFARAIEQAARREALSGVEAICADAMDANEALNEIRALSGLIRARSDAPPAPVPAVVARLVSYAPDGSTCTLNIDGNEVYFDRHIDWPEDNGLHPQRGLAK
jgi:hypothetical protein